MNVLTSIYHSSGLKKGRKELFSKAPKKASHETVNSAHEVNLDKREDLSVF